MNFENESNENLLKLYDQITDFIKFLNKEKSEMKEQK